MTTRFGTLDWRTLSREALDSGLNNSAAVPGSGDMVDGWGKLSAETRARHNAHLGLSYGPRERNRIDFLKAVPNARGAVERYEQWNIDAQSVVSFAGMSFS